MCCRKEKKTEEKPSQPRFPLPGRGMNPGPKSERWPLMEIVESAKSNKCFSAYANHTPKRNTISDFPFAPKYPADSRIKIHSGAKEKCEGCDIVQSDHAPQAGVAQGIFDGELVRRRVGHQVELEEEQGKEVERRVMRDAQRTTHKCACMDDMYGMTHKARP